MARKRLDRLGVGSKAKLDWQQIVDPSVPSADLPEPTSASGQAHQSLEEDWLRAAVPQSIVSNAQPIASPPSRKTRRVRHKRAVKPASSAKRTGWGWSLLWLIAFGICGGLGAIAFVLLTTLPPLPNCQKITPLSAEVDRLYCAQTAAQSGEVEQLAAALDAVGQWSPSHPLYGEAQHRLEEWSTAMLAIARTAFNQGNLEKATELLNHIPKSSPVYGEAQTTIASWRQQWQQGEKIYETAQTAIKTQNWNQASAQVPALAQVESEYWQRQRVDDLTQQILMEKQAWQYLVEARKLAQGNKPEDLGAAIVRLEQVDNQSYAWTQAQANLDQWSQSLIKTGLQRWQQGDRAGAIVAVQQLPAGLNLAPDARDLVQFSHAELLVTQTQSQWQPSVKQAWDLMEALAAVRRIQPSSPFYVEARRQVQGWQQQLQDVMQLQFANVTASLGQKLSFELAIDQAEQIHPDRPRRLQAQTLMAHWRQEIQRLEDRPYLARAETLAKPGTISALRSAIAQASVIPQGRALRIDAQSLIARWNNQIEMIEDQPILDQARSLAQEGRLSRAISVAQKIGRDRALYAEAQAAVSSWRAEIRRIQIAEDRPILNEAYGLAESGSLTLAIETAAQIGSGRALYNEAQGAIAQWEAEREAIWSTWESESAPEDDSYYEDDGYSEDEGYFEDDGYYEEDAY